jgi:peptide/nickel transport system substrate-binding protein
VAALAALLVAGCAGSSEASSADPGGKKPKPLPAVATTVQPLPATDGGVLRVAVDDLGSFDPLAVNIGSASNLLVADLIFDGLTDVSPGELEASPAIASGWSANNDLDVWTFELDPERTFANGEPITVDDVVFSLDRARKSFALIWQSLTVIESVEAVDDVTVRIRLGQPTVGLAELLAAPSAGILPEDLVTADAAAFASKPVGSGPFGRVETTADGVTLSATSEDVRLDAVEVIDAGSADEAWELQQQGQVDMAVVPEGEPSTDEVIETPFRALLFLGINVNHPSLRSPAVRRAVVASLDAADVTELVLGDRAEPTDGVGVSADACGPLCEQDPVAGAELVAALEDDVPVLHVDHRDDPMEKELADAVVADLEAAGFEAEARSHAAAEYSEFLVSGDQEIFRFGHVGVAPVGDAYLPLMFGSEAQNNVTGFGSTDLDQAMVDAATQGTWDELEREIMTDSAPVIPVARYVSRWAVSEHVSGLEIDRDGTFDPTSVVVSEAE